MQLGAAESTIKSPALFSLTWPIFVEIFLHMLMGNVNTMMLGHYSDDAVAAVGVATQVLGILIVIFGFVATGSSILVAQYLGANEPHQAQQAAVTAISLNFLFGIAISIVMVLFGKTFLQWMDLKPALMEPGLLYLNAVGAFLFLEALMLTMSAIVRAHGHTKWVMYVTIAMNVINVFGCWLVLYQPFGLPSFGVQGVATVIIVSRLLGLIGVIVIMFRLVNLSVRLREWFQLSKKYVHQLLQIGVPSAGEHMAYHSSQLLITAFVNAIGTLALTTKIYVANLGLFIFLFSVAIGMGTQILVGHLVGAKRFEEAYRRAMRSLKIAIGVAMIISIVFAIAAPKLFLLFTKNQEIIEMASMVLLMTIILEPGRCINLVIINSLKAAGDTKFPVIMGVISMWGISVPLAWYLGVYLEWGLIGVYISFIVDEWVRGLFMIWRWRSRVWQRMSFV